MLWQSVFLLAPRTRWTQAAGTPFQIDCTAPALARYEPAIAMELYRSRNVITDTYGQLSDESAVSLLVLEPPKLARWVRSQTTIGRSYRGYEAVGKLLRSGADDFWDLVSKPYVMQWPSERFEAL